MDLFPTRLLTYAPLNIVIFLLPTAKSAKYANHNTGFQVKHVGCRSPVKQKTFMPGPPKKGSNEGGVCAD